MSSSSKSHAATKAASPAKSAPTSLANNPLADGASLLSGGNKAPTVATVETKAASPEEASRDLVRVYHLNKHGGSFIHTIPADPNVEGSIPIEYRLDKGGVADVPQFVADAWLSHKGFQGCDLVSLVAASGPARVDPKLAAVEAKNAELEAQNKDFDARLKGLESMLAAAKAAGFKPKE